MNMTRHTTGFRGNSRRKFTGLAMAASLMLPAGVVAGLGLASSAPAGAAVTPQIATNDGSVYVPIQPCRLIDTVSGSGYTDNGQTLVSGDESITTPDLHHACGGQVPNTTDLDAIVINLTAVNPSASGFLTAFGAGQQPPATSTVNFVAGQTIANEATISTTQKHDSGTDACCTEGYGGEITIDNWQGSTDVIVDVQGYYTSDYIAQVVKTASPGSNIVNNGGLYYPLAPSRVADTRSDSGYQDQNETLGPQSQINFLAGDEPNLPGGTVPVHTVAVVLNVTAINPTAASYLTVWGTGSTQPFTSNLNFPAGTTIANRVIVPVASNGQVSILNWAGTVNVAVDVDGYFANVPTELPGFCAANAVKAGTPSSKVGTCTGSAYYPLVTPERIADTRTGSTYEDSSQVIHGGEYDTVAVPVDAFGPFNAFDPKHDTDFAPSDFVAADINATVTDTTAPSYLTLYPSNTELAIPQASDINWVPGDIISNGDIISTGTSAPFTSFQAFNYAGTTDLVIDLYGYFSTEIDSAVAPPAPINVVASPVTIAAGSTPEFSVSFTTPGDGGCAITSYTVTGTDTTNTASPDITATGTGSPIVVSGGVVGDNYTFTVTATNCAGTSDPSDASPAVPAATVPDAPTLKGNPPVVYGALGSGDYTVKFKAPNNANGCPITTYTVTGLDAFSPGEPELTGTGTGSPIVVTGGEIGQTYNFTVTATNCDGTSVASDTSPNVTGN